MTIDLTKTILAGTVFGLCAAPNLANAQGRELGSARGFLISPASTQTDLAPTRIGDDGIARLRMTDQEFTNEQASCKATPDGRLLACVHMRTSPINEGTAMESSPVHQMQCAGTILETYQLSDGSVGVRRPASAMYDFWLTDNDGNEYRNCNKPEVLLLDNAQYWAVEFNYQEAGSGDTKRYAKVLDFTGQQMVVKDGNGEVRDQVLVMAKQNDDCSMHQSGRGQAGIPYIDANGTTEFISWDGCNGNGDDDGWARLTRFVKGPDGAFTITKVFDISLAQQEERSRGSCTPFPSLDMALCTATEGNTQPQRDGTWIYAVDLSADNQNGPDAQARLLWKEQLNERQTFLYNGVERECYAMRANHMSVLQKLADGTVGPTDEIIYTDACNRGGNNDNNKGGRTSLMNFAVIKASRTGLEFTMPMQTISLETSNTLLGLDGTHLSMNEAIFGKGDTLLPGFTLLQGSQTGGLQQDADIRMIAYDPATKSLVNLGQQTAGASYDRHLYSNYLGNNPGNQGRNFAGSTIFKNPFVGIGGNQVTHYVAYALTGKAPEHVDSAIKPSFYVSLMPVAFTADAPDPGGGYNDNLPGDETPDQPAPPADRPIVTNQTSAGCSATSSTGAGMLLVVLGLAFTFRRRRN